MSGPNLLLVDDAPDLGLIVGMLARRAGLTFAHVLDSESATRELERNPPELVLLDVNLPGTSGVEWLRRLRTAERGTHTHVALFCQEGLSRDVAAGWAAGADYLLAKDLVGQPGPWRARLEEIRAHLRGQAEVPSLGSTEEAIAHELASWGDVLDQALDLPILRRVGVEVITELLRRGLVRGFGTQAEDGWLRKDLGRLVVAALPRSTVEGVWRLYASLIDQFWCLLGARESRAFADALRTAFGDPKP